MSISRTADRALDPTTFQGPGEADVVSSLLKETGGTLTLKALQGAYSKSEATDPARAEVLRRILQAAVNPRPAGSYANQAALRSEPAVETAKVTEPAAVMPEDVVKFRSDISMVKGQDQALDAFTRFYRKIRTGLSPKPNIALLPGPPGVGKTLTASAVAYALTGNPDAYLTVDCTELSDTSVAKKHFGVTQGFAQHEESKKTATFAPHNVQQKIPGNGPVVILVDELDKITNADVKALVSNKLNRFLETAKMPLENGLELDLTGRQVIVLITSNAGADDVGNKEGEELDKHFLSAAETALASHTNSRIDAIIPYRPLNSEVSRQIAGREMEVLFKTAQGKAQKEQGKVVAFEANDEVAKLLSNLSGGSVTLGARPIKSAVAQLISVKVGDVLNTAEDDSLYAAVVRKGAEGKLKELQAAFAKTGGKVPSTLTPEDFPVDFVLKNPPPVVVPYEGKMPVSGWAKMVPFAGGTVAGRGYFVANTGEFDAPNQMWTLREKGPEALDKMEPVTLPEELAAANREVKAVTIDEPASVTDPEQRGRRAFFMALNCPSKGEAELSAFIYDPVGRRKEDSPFVPVPPPPVPLYGAAMASIDGQIILWGGRVVECIGGEWSCKLDPTESVGALIENRAYKLDLETSKWIEIPNMPSAARAKAAMARVGDKLWIVGGEEVAFTSSGATYSIASTRVDIYDPKTGEFTRGPDLPTGRTNATLNVDQFGRVEISGGEEIGKNGFERHPLDSVLRIDPGVAEPQWKVRKRLPLAGADIVNIPDKRGGTIKGPFFEYDETGTFTTRFLIEKSPANG